MTRLRFVILAVVAIVIGIGIAIGCGRGEPSRDSGLESGTAVVDMELMAFLSEARALHHQANLKEEIGDLTGAAGSMERLVGARRPHEGKAPEVQEVLADAYARLAELRLRERGDARRATALDRAAEAVKAGLVYAPEPTYFRGHLIEVEGLIEEARANELADGGRLEAAVRSREKAIQLLEEVVRIQDQVIQRSLSARDALDAQTDGGR
jgi:hypothetical protein